MVVKFHCEFCDKVFNDTKASRKRHMTSPVHLRNKQFWYDSFRATGLSWNAEAPGEWQPVPADQLQSRKRLEGMELRPGSETKRQKTLRMLDEDTLASLPPSLKLQSAWGPVRVDWG